MKNYKIYEDDEIKVEIHGAVHEFLQECVSPYFILPSDAHKTILGYIASQVIESKPELAHNIMVSYNKIYVISHGEKLHFEEPFDYFNEAAAEIAEVEDFDNSLLQIVQNIKDLYPEEEFFFEIFPFPIVKVRGYFAYYDEDNIYVLLFSR